MSVEELAAALVRDYLSSKGLGESLNSFEREVKDSTLLRKSELAYLLSFEQEQRRPFFKSVLQSIVSKLSKNSKTAKGKTKERQPKQAAEQSPRLHVQADKSRAKQAVFVPAKRVDYLTQEFKQRKTQTAKSKFRASLKQGEKPPKKEGDYIRLREVEGPPPIAYPRGTMQYKYLEKKQHYRVVKNSEEIYNLLKNMKPMSEEQSSLSNYNRSEPEGNQRLINQMEQLVQENESSQFSNLGEGRPSREEWQEEMKVLKTEFQFIDLNSLENKDMVDKKVDSQVQLKLYEEEEAQVVRPRQFWDRVDIQQYSDQFNQPPPNEVSTPQRTQQVKAAPPLIQLGQQLSPQPLVQPAQQLSPIISAPPVLQKKKVIQPDLIPQAKFNISKQTHWNQKVCKIDKFSEKQQEEVKVNKVLQLQVPVLKQPAQKLQEAVSQTSQPSQTQPQKKAFKMFRRKKEQEDPPIEQQTKEAPVVAKEEEPSTKLQYIKIEKVDCLIVNPAFYDRYKTQYSKLPTVGRRKLNWKPIQDISNVKKMLLGESTKRLPKSWSQGWIVSNCPDTDFGLFQNQGGPCGLIAAMQCYYLKNLLDPSRKEQREGGIKSEHKEAALTAAIAELLLRTSGEEVVLVRKKMASSETVQLQSCEEVRLRSASFQQVFDLVAEVRKEYTEEGGSGVALTLYSAVLGHGLNRFIEEMDSAETPLIGSHGHCSQQLVNLFLCGRASTNCFDGVKKLDDQFRLGGIPSKSLFGFLTIFEHLKYMEVGKYLKRPVYPFWVVCKEYHYSVLFAQDYRVGELCTEQPDLVYYDGLYTKEQLIRLSLRRGTPPPAKVRPMIEEVIWTNWGECVVDWNGTDKIL